MAPHFSLLSPSFFSILLLNVGWWQVFNIIFISIQIYFHISGMHTSLQPLGECHCWWTRVSPRAHVAKFYIRLQLIRSVLRASKVSMLKFIEIVFLKIYYMASLLLQLLLVLLWHLFETFKLLCLAKITDEGSVPELRIWSILLEIRFKMVYTSWSFLYFKHFTHLVSATARGPESPWGHMQPSSLVDFSWFIAFREHQHFPYWNLLK